MPIPAIRILQSRPTHQRMHFHSDAAPDLSALLGELSELTETFSRDSEFPFMDAYHAADSGRTMQEVQNAGQSKARITDLGSALGQRMQKPGDVHVLGTSTLDERDLRESMFEPLTFLTILEDANRPPGNTVSKQSLIHTLQQDRTNFTTPQQAESFINAITRKSHITVSGDTITLNPEFTAKVVAAYRDKAQRAA